MKLTILTKGWILVGIPLCFEVTIFGCLIHLQDDVERDAQRISRNKRLNDGVNAIVHDCIAITDATQNYSTIPGFDAARTSRAMVVIKARMQDISDRYEQLKELAKDDPKIFTQVQNCGMAFDRTKHDLLALRDNMQHASFDDVPLILNHGRKKLDADIHACLRAGVLELGEESLKGTDDVESRRLREKTRLLLYCALGFSILFAGIVATSFSRDLARRLSRLSANANKLAKGEPLLAPIGGTDEVAELDRNFHYAADLIEAAKRMRQEVVAMITHDLKTPLQSIRSYFEMLNAGMLGELNDRGTRLLDISQKSSEHMVQLIDSVLELEKLRTGNVSLQSQQIDLSQLLDRCLQSVKVLADTKEVTLVPHYEHSTADILFGDAFWLQEVFINILSNAIKFTAEKSQVCVNTRDTNGNVEIAVVDQGPGISKEQINLIFERFHRVPSTTEIAGSGLGLSIAKELIELHHGSISVVSEVGKGSTFIIKLPISPNAKKQ